MTQARLALLALCLLLAAALHPGPARAHATLLGADPADRSALETSPTQVALRFSEPVQVVFVRLLDAGGRVLAEARAGVDDALIVMPVPSPLAVGNYLVSYRAISADAHPVAGTLLFAVGAAPAQWPAAEGAELHTPAWRAVAAANRALHFLALALVAGATVFLALAKPLAPVLRLHLGPSIGAATLLGVGTAVAAIVAQGGIALDAPLGNLSDAWREGLRTTQARQSIAAGALLLATWQAGWAPRARAAWPSALIAVAALATLAATGHVVTAKSQWLTVPVLLAHALPALLWVGSFVPLMLALEGRDGGAALLRFSRVAPLTLAVLLASGVGIAVVQVRTWGALIGTAYGQALLLKAGLVGGLLLLAAANRWRLTALAARGDDEPRAALRRTIAAELGLAAAVLAVTAVLAQTPPPRSLRSEAPATSEEHQHEGAAEPGYAVGAVAQGKTAIIAVVPARSGRNTLTFALRGAGWADITPRSVTAILNNAGLGIEPIVRELPRVGAGIYELVGPEFAVPGDWTVKIDVLINDFEHVTYTAPIPVQ